jgi:hypothetical protein
MAGFGASALSHSGAVHQLEDPLRKHRTEKLAICVWLLTSRFPTSRVEAVCAKLRFPSSRPGEYQVSQHAICWLTLEPQLAQWLTACFTRARRVSAVPLTKGA